MDVTRQAVWATVGLIVGVMLVSGPLVGPLDFTGHNQDIYCEASGDATVMVEEVPADAYSIEPHDGDEYYAVAGPPVRLGVSDVEGCPVVTFELRIPELGFRSVRKSFLSPGDGPRISMAVTGGRFDPERIDDESYPASIEIRLQGDENRTLHSGDVTVGVSHDS